MKNNPVATDSMIARQEPKKQVSFALDQSEFTGESSSDLEFDSTSEYDSDGDYREHLPVGFPFSLRKTALKFF
jgi:hypothetical protein